MSQTISHEKDLNEGQHGIHRVFYSARQTLRHYASGGNVLIVATVLALIVANIPGLNNLYFDFWNQEIRLQIGDFNIFSHDGHPMTVLQFINDALMAIFFFTIGLEIKREVLVGELASIRQALLPIIAAIGGMAVPVLIFFAMGHGSDYIDGAAIPMATDIAFSLGILGMLGSRVPISLKIFLTTLAVVDDIGGIIVIAAFYSGHIEAMFLVYALVLLLVLYLGGRFGVQSKMFYFLIGGVVWFLFLNSGIHPTIAGVLVAFCVPAIPVYAPVKYIKIIRREIGHFRQEDDETLHARTILTHEQMDHLKEIESASDKVISPLQDMEDSLHPVVNYLIVPLFAFANAGIYLLNIQPASIFAGLSLTIILALVLGKFLGIFLFSFLSVKLKLAPMPERSNWKMIASIAVLGGIGFTVSLFIANLSFDSSTDAHLLDMAKLGIVVGSLIAGIGGFLLLHKTLPATGTENEDEN
ncbi:MAG: Na+/H+ antiporter NhaA [Muribaculaceae bacterium]|nr:Na+/H+ antiporter NhaA [Muribaculaceae bacterium]MDE6351813.1 Na+/H+ antiporter NhaA [Muribaculaceae bacterium]MDE6642677.1 Na+/H+ antiporter NhaA [Muribaculaceae bacterium]MDE7092552.1 Na+/H+ antiporter NhaA [Muribaculaceae bacterium]